MVLSQTICFRFEIWRISLREGKCFSFIFHSFTILYSKSKVAAKNRRSHLHCVTMGEKLRNVCFPLTLTQDLYRNIKKLNSFKVYAEEQFVSRDIHVCLNSDIDTMMPPIFQPGFKHLTMSSYYWQTSSLLQTQ